MTYTTSDIADHCYTYTDKVVKVAKRYKIGKRIGKAYLFTHSDMLQFEHIILEAKIKDVNILKNYLSNNPPIKKGPLCTMVKMGNTKIERVLADFTFMDPNLWEDDYGFLHYK